MLSFLKLKSLGIILVTCYLLLVSFVTPTFAQSSSPTASPLPAGRQDLPLTALPSTVSPTSPLYMDLLVSNMFHSFSCLAIGQSVIGQPCLTYQFEKNAQGLLQGVPVLAQNNLSGGALGTVTSLIGAMYQNPPVRTANYVASLGEEMGIVKTAHAQGVGVVGSGAQVLNPIFLLWQTSRNITYVIMIIIFIIIGIMVMVRNRINPQTVITAQAALPGLVIGLILITFSYFLAGLISDTAFLGTNLVGYYFTYAQNQPPQDLVEDTKQLNVLNIFTPFTRVITVGKVRDALNTIWNDLGDPSIAIYDITALDGQKALKMVAIFIVSQFIAPIGTLVPGWGQVAAGAISVGAGATAPLYIVGIALAFIATLALLYTMFRLLLRLINSFLTIIFLTITAPFQFLFASLPGRQGIATNWILNMLSNVLAFPAVLAVLYFVAFILGPDFTKQHWHCDTPGNPCPFIITQNSTTKDLVPAAYALEPGNNIVGTATFPLLGGLNFDFMKLLLAFGTLMALPAIPDIITRSIGTLSQSGQLIGQEISSGVGAGRGYSAQAQQAGHQTIGQAGRLTNERGWYLAEEKGTGKTYWRKVGADSPIDIQARMINAGQFTRVKGSLGNFWGGVRKRIGR